MPCFRACALVIFACAVAALFAAPCHGKETLTLDRALDLALERNPGIAVSAQDVAASQARVSQAVSATRPQVGAQAGYQRKWYANEKSATGAGATDNPFDWFTASVSLSQYIYDFGQTGGKIESGRQELAAARQDLKKTAADVVRDVKYAYYEVLKRERLAVVSDESILIQEQHLAQSRGLYEIGARPKIDVTKAEADLAASRLTRIQARNAASVARVNLESILGGPPLQTPYDLVNPAEPAPLSPVAGSLQSLVREAMARRPDVLALEARIRAAQSRLSSMEALRYPSLTGQGSYAWQDTGVWMVDQNAWQLGAQATWTLYAGGKIEGQIAESRAGLQALKEQTRQLRLSVFGEVSSSHLNVAAAKEAIETARVALANAQENMNLAEGRYKAGAGSAIEYSDAQLALTQAKSNLVQATYLLLQDQADLEKSLGKGAPGK